MSSDGGSESENEGYTAGDYESEAYGIGTTESLGMQGMGSGGDYESEAYGIAPTPGPAKDNELSGDAKFNEALKAANMDPNSFMDRAVAKGFGLLGLGPNPAAVSHSAVMGFAGLGMPGAGLLGRGAQYVEGKIRQNEPGWMSAYSGAPGTLTAGSHSGPGSEFAPDMGGYNDYYVEPITVPQPPAPLPPEQPAPPPPPEYDFLRNYWAGNQFYIPPVTLKG